MSQLYTKKAANATVRSVEYNMAVHHQSSPSSLSPHASSLTRSVFYSELETWLFSKCFPPETFSFPTGLITRTLGPSNFFTLLNGCIGKCVRLSRLLVGFRMHFKSLHFHSFIHSFNDRPIVHIISFTLSPM